MSPVTGIDVTGQVGHDAERLEGSSMYTQRLSITWYDCGVIDKKQLSEYFSALGRKSAKARMKKLSAKRRHVIARNAAKARWAKPRSRKKVKRGAGSKIGPQ